MSADGARGAAAAFATARRAGISDDPWRCDCRNGACAAMDAVPLAAVVSLWVSDRGQHRWLVDRVRHLAPGHILFLSIGAALLLNLVATAAAYVFGVVAWWVWMG